MKKYFDVYAWEVFALVLVLLASAVIDIQIIGGMRHAAEQIVFSKSSIKIRWRYLIKNQKISLYCYMVKPFDAASS